MDLVFDVAMIVVEQQQQGRAGKRDRAGLQSDGARGHEAEDHQGDDEERLLQQPPVIDGLTGVEGHDPGARHLVGLHLAAPDQMVDQDLGQQHDHDDRPQIDDKIIE